MMTVRCRGLAATMVALALGAATGAAAKSSSRKLTEQEIRALPGYVDVDFARVFANREAKVEVNLKSPMLDLMAKFANDDPDLPGILSNLKLVRVQVFDVDTDDIAKASKVAGEAAKRLDTAGWERVVRVRERDERVDVYFKPSADNQALDGIVVMVIGEDDEAVFVNIVGRIHPDDVQRLGERFDIRELDSLRAERHRSR